MHYSARKEKEVTGPFLNNAEILYLIKTTKVEKEKEDLKNTNQKLYSTNSRLDNTNARQEKPAYSIEEMKALLLACKKKFQYSSASDSDNQCSSTTLDTVRA